MSKYTDKLRAIFHGTMEAVDVSAAVQRAIRCYGSSLHIANFECNLKEVNRILIIAIGKSATPMYEAAVVALRHRLEVEAVLVSPLPLASNRQLTVCPAAHPIPDEHSRRAAATILTKLRAADERTLVLFLISGGASAMVEQPLDPGISIADTARFYQTLVTSSLPIAKINSIRKHFSAVKGGRLACAAARSAAVCTLVASDVPSGLTDSVGSGPSLPDSTNRQECLEALHHVMETTMLPDSVSSFFHSKLFVETPKPDDPIFARNYSANILSSTTSSRPPAARPARLGSMLSTTTPATNGTTAKLQTICSNAPASSVDIIQRFALSLSENSPFRSKVPAEKVVGISSSHFGARWRSHDVKSNWPCSVQVPTASTGKAQPQVLSSTPPPVAVPASSTLTHNTF